MTIEAYAIAVSAKLEDGVTPALLRIIDSLERANALMLDFSANVRAMSRGALSVAKSLDKATASSAALGDTAGGLTRASYVLDTMAASSSDLAANMAAARAESSRIGRSGGIGGYGPRGGGSNSEDGKSSNRSSGMAAGAVGISAAYGIYENARLQDLNVRGAATSQIPIAAWASSIEDMRQREFAYASKYAFATHGKIEPFGEAMLESSRLLRTLSPANQKKLTDAAMPYAAVESKLKGIPLPEAVGSFIGLAHQAGAYSPKAAIPLFEAMMQASLTTHASLQQIARASSYALPALHAAGANSTDVLMMLATMMQAGILNTKSGTWLNALAMNALPNSLGSGLFTNKKQNAALQDLGLYKNGKSQFYKNGEFNLMKEVAILAAARERMSPLEFNAATRMAFGMQGQRAASLFAEPQVVANLHALAALTGAAQAPGNIGSYINQLSTVAKADQTIANANMTLMNATSTFMGPVNGALSGASGFFGWTSKFTAAHPVAGGVMDAGLALGAAGALGAAWKGGKMGVDLVGKKIISPLIGVLWKRVFIPAVSAVASAGIDGALALAAGASVAEAGVAVSALGAGIAGVAGYLLGKAITAGINDAAHLLGAKDFDLPSWLGGEAFKLFHHDVTPPAANHPITVHSPIHIDGKKVAEIVTKHQANTLQHAPAGPSPAIHGLTLPYPSQAY